MRAALFGAARPFSTLVKSGGLVYACKFDLERISFENIYLLCKGLLANLATRHSQAGFARRRLLTKPACQQPAAQAQAAFIAAVKRRSGRASTNSAEGGIVISPRLALPAGEQVSQSEVAFRRFL